MSCIPCPGPFVMMLVPPTCVPKQAQHASQLSAAARLRALDNLVLPAWSALQRCRDRPPVLCPVGPTRSRFSLGAPVRWPTNRTFFLSFRQVQNKNTAQQAILKLQRAFRKHRVRTARIFLSSRCPGSAKIAGPTEASVIKISDGPPPIDVAGIAALVSSSSIHGSWWFRARMRWNRRSIHATKAVAQYGDLASMTIIFPGLLAAFICFSML